MSLSHSFHILPSPTTNQYVLALSRLANRKVTRSCIRVHCMSGLWMVIANNHWSQINNTEVLLTYVSACQKGPQVRTLFTV